MQWQQNIISRCVFSFVEKLISFLISHFSYKWRLSDNNASMTANAWSLLNCARKKNSIEIQRRQCYLLKLNCSSVLPWEKSIKFHFYLQHTLECCFDRIYCRFKEYRLFSTAFCEDNHINSPFWRLYFTTVYCIVLLDSAVTYFRLNMFCPISCVISETQVNLF